jgi:hypothetical protein
MQAAREAWLALSSEQREALRILIDVYLIDQVIAWDSERAASELRALRVQSRPV